jgi:hypothetical protein
MSDEEEDKMIQEMNRNGRDGADFKEPLPKISKVQERLLNKNKESTLMLFSKLPCIKTCISKVSFNEQNSSSCSFPNKSISF